MKNVSLLAIMRSKPPVLAGDRLVLFGVSLLLAILFLFTNIHNASAGVSLLKTHDEEQIEWRPIIFHDFVRELSPDDLNCINLTNNNKVTRALLIGIQNNENSLFKGSGTTNDVTLILHALEARGVLPENIQVRIKGAAKRQTVIKDFSRLLKESQCGDGIVLFLSGYGSQHIVEGIAGERWSAENPELKEVIIEKRRQPFMVFEDVIMPNSLTDAISEGILTATELQNFVKASRIKGIDAVVIIDVPSASKFELEAAAEPTWKCCADEQTFQQKSVYGQLTTLYSPLAAIEEVFDGKTYGIFSFWVGTALSQPKLAKTKDLIQNIYTSYEKYLVQKFHSRKKMQMPSFSSSDPNRPILRSLNAPIATENFTITLDAPKKTRGVPLLPTKKLTGKISPNDGLIAVVVLGKIATLSEDGAFTVELPLKRGENLVDIMAVYDNRRHHVEQIVVHSSLGEYEVTQSPRTYALLIGNQNYSPESGFENLETPHRDIDALKTLLSERYGMQTYIENPNNTQHSLVIRDASREDIYNALRIIAEVAEKDDSVLIYYAGHGKTIDLNVEKKLAYWIPANARIDVEAADWISANDINDLVARIQAQHVLVIADSCYSGVLARDKTNLVINEKNRDRYLSEMSKKKSRYLVSSGGDEPVSDGGGDGHSIFARTLLTALEKPLAPIFTVEQVFHDKIKQSVANNSRQVPQMQVIHDTGHDNGSFVFFKKAQ